MLFQAVVIFLPISIFFKILSNGGKVHWVRNIADDILIYGTTYEEHNKALKECLQRLELLELTLNLDKCRFLKNHLQFFGLLLSHDGVRPDPKKVSAFYNTTFPTTVGE